MTPLRLLPWLAVLAFGAGWGAMQPANKIAVGGGFQPFGIMVWQGVITLTMAGLLAAKWGLPRGRAQWMICGQVAILGTLIPHFATFTAVAHVPAGLVALVLASIPIFALILGAALGREPLTVARVAGLSCGFGAMILIARSQGAVTGASIWAVCVGLVAPLCYALNSVMLASRGMAGLHPLQVFAGAAALFLPVSLLAAVATGQLRGVGWDGPSFAVLSTALGHTFIYAGFLWLVTTAGAVFASQTAYFVTGFGILWSMIFLGERYDAAVWWAVVLMCIGVSLVRPATSRVATTGRASDN